MQEEIITHLICPRVIESIQPQGSLSLWIFQGVLMLIYIGIRDAKRSTSIDPKAEMSLELCEEGDAILGTIFPIIISFYIEEGRYVYCIMGNTMLVGQTEYVVG